MYLMKNGFRLSTQQNDEQMTHLHKFVSWTVIVLKWNETISTLSAIVKIILEKLSLVWQEIIQIILAIL